MSKHPAPPFPPGPPIIPPFSLQFADPGKGVVGIQYRAVACPGSGYNVAAMGGEPHG